MKPTELINLGPWDHALFTTYSLSLSFYETQIHKLGLARNGCRDIRIVADADGYQLSLSERQSNRVGNEYRLTPAALPDGVFHPKVIWLAGKELDLLLLGSGNLTFGGFGRNVENLEVLRSDRAPGVFFEVAGMMEAWRDREDLWFAESDWTSFWADRGRAWGAAAHPSAAPVPELLHSTNRSIADQVLERAAGGGGAVELCVLSPYFDPDAAGILDFADALGCPRLTVGILPGRETNTTFPFGGHRGTRCEVAAASFSAPADKRRLHAKVLEVRMADGSAFVVTGSVNATRKSLLTTDNIETAVLRRYPASAPRPFAWIPCEAPASFRLLPFEKAGLGTRVVVSGRLNGDGRLEGALIARKDPSGSWQGTLQRIDGSSFDLCLSVDPTGAFSGALENPELFQESAGLQLRVARGEAEGVGWVSVEGLLLAARRGFLNPATVMRLLGDDPDESDEAELLRYLATSAHRHLPAFSSGRSTAGARAKDGAEDPGKGHQSRTLSVDLLVSRESGALGGSPDLQDPGCDNEMLNAYMARIRQNLLRRQIYNKSAVELEEAGDDRASIREEQERERSRKQLTTSLDDFQSQLRSLAARASVGWERSAALCMWLEVTFPILLRRLAQPEETELFLNQWLTHCLLGQRIGNSSEILVRHVVGTLLTLSSAVLSRTTDTGRRLGRLHEQLEVFCGDSPLEKVCERLELLDPAQAPLASEILENLPSAPPLAEALAAILGTPTTRQQLDLVLRCVKAGSPLPADLPILALQAGKDYAAQVEMGRFPTVRSVSMDTTSCPHCHMKLRKTTLHDVERDRFGTCRDCNRFLIASI